MEIGASQACSSLPMFILKPQPLLSMVWHRRKTTSTSVLFGLSGSMLWFRPSLDERGAASARTKHAQKAGVDLLDAGLRRGAIRSAEDGVLDQQADGRDDRLLAATGGVRPRREI